MRKSADYVVIGAGIIGIAVTYYLAKAGLSVCLLERGRFCAGFSIATHTQIAMYNRVSGFNLFLL